VKVFQILIGLVLSFSALTFGCKKAEMPSDNIENFVIDSIRVFSINNDPLYVNYNINNTKIDALVENDGVSGKLFIVKFIFPNGITPLSISPDISKPVDFKNPVTFEIQYSTAIKKTYSFTLNEEAVNPAKYNIESIQVLNDDNTPSNIKLSQAGSDYVGLTQNQASSKKYKLKITFPSKITPVSISPDPTSVTDFSKDVVYTVKYDDQIVKTYTVKIGNYNTSDFARKVVRGVWVSDVGSDVFASKTNIAECVNICKDIGINTIFVVTYNDAKTKYKSQVMKEYMGVEIDPKYTGRDPLAEMIEAAKPHGIKVVAWFEYGFASVYGDNTGGALIAKYPSWASRDAGGSITEKNKFYWLDAFNPDVQQFIKKLMVEVVQKYPDLAGVQGDDRLPALASNGGYNASVTALYKTETGRTAPSNYLDTHWLQWRANKLSDFGEYIFKHIKSLNGKQMVSWSPSPYSWSLQNYLQDWPEWMRRNIVDHLHPQLYRTNFNDYKASFDQAMTNLAPFNFKELIFSPGILVGVGSGDSITPETLDQKLAYNRSKGIDGETFFYYERIRKNKAFQDVIKKHNK
jgi:uncharacterized lipoprotein YddW (UPF0748 family)